ncbi:hypothetical protein FBU30_009499 [Linnemannia zychae]|nr:hypothetical protein FBU30_009499 [Linnemannia zychae]
MWFLVGQHQNSGLRIWLKPEMTLTIGRQSTGKRYTQQTFGGKRLDMETDSFYVEETGDVLNLAGEDRSVSRRHVVITVSKPSLNSVKIRGEYTKLTLRDLDSKSGVSVNNRRIEPGKDIEIIIDDDHLWTVVDKRHIAGRGYGGWVDVNIGDKTDFRLERVDWNICSVGLSLQSKLGIIEMAAEMDIKVEDSWIPNVSTHVVIGNNKVSQRIFLALAEGGYLVDPTWLKQQLRVFQESWETKGATAPRLIELEHPAPTPSGYEDPNIHWEPNFLRRTLFRDYHFISVTKPKALPKPCSSDPMRRRTVDTGKCAGGAKTSQGMYIKDSNSCVLKTGWRYYFESCIFQCKPIFKEEVEIGSALAYASTDMYCNPKYLDELPVAAMMSTLASIQAPFSEFEGSATSTQSSINPTISRTVSAIQDTKDSLLHLDEAEDTTTGTFGLSQLMAPSRKVSHSSSTTTTHVSHHAHQHVKAKSINEPVKKKAKTDHMALFFDGLDDEFDAIEVNSQRIANNSTAQNIPTFVEKGTKQSSILQTPVPIAWPDSIIEDIEQDEHLRIVRRTEPKKDGDDISSITSAESKKMSSPSIATTSKASKAKAKFKLMDAMFEDDDSEESVQSNTVQDSNYSGQDDISLTDATTIAQECHNNKPIDKTKGEMYSYPVKESNTQSDRSVSATRGPGKKKKPTSFDVIRDDMVALNLGVKLERQIYDMEEKERWKHLKPQPFKSSDPSKVMQWERCAELNIKNKRRKVKENVGQSSHEAQRNPVKEGSDELADEIQILDESDQKDWPERWKKMANFKNFSGPSPELKEKWKNVPNFKAFRKAKMPGIKVEPREPLQLTLDGELMPKQEATAKKIATFLKREPEEPTTPIPAPRRKISEKQREKDDLQRLLADD